MHPTNTPHVSFSPWRSPSPSRWQLGEDLDETQVYDMICEAISNFDGKIYYDGFVKIMVAK